MTISDGLLVSIHDVTPAHEDRIRELWRLCRACSSTPALLVVPDWHGRWPLRKHDSFVGWVRSCASAGAEIILHGERHDEIGLARGWRDNVRAFGRTSREGEFLTLDADEAFERISRGLALFRELGLCATGFIPPAWLARDATHEAVARAGLKFSEDEGGVRIHETRLSSLKVAAPAVRWSGRTVLRAHGSALVAKVRWKRQRHSPFVRIALHPQDLDSDVTARSLEAELKRMD